MWTPPEDDDDEPDDDAPPPPVDLDARRRARAAAGGDEFDLAGWWAERAKRREEGQREKAAQLVDAPTCDPLAESDEERRKAERDAQRGRWDDARERYRRAGQRARPWPDDGPLMPVEASGYYRRPPAYITGDEQRERFPFSADLA